MRFPPVLLGMISIAGLILLGLAIWVASENYASLAYSQQKEGIVIAIEVRKENISIQDENNSYDGNPRLVYYPKIRYQPDEDSKPYEFVSHFGSSPSQYDVGDRVIVSFRPDQPEQARLGNFAALWLGAIIAGVLGLILLLLGAIPLLLQAKKPG